MDNTIRRLDVSLLDDGRIDEEEGIVIIVECQLLRLLLSSDSGDGDEEIFVEYRT